MSAVTTARIPVRSIRPTVIEGWMLRLAAMIESHVARRVERRADAMRDIRSGSGGIATAREDCMVRAHSVGLRMH